MPFADGDYTFKLPIGQVIELQEKCGAGVGEIYSRLMAGRYRNTLTGQSVLNTMEARFKIEDVRETIRLALIGGNQAMVDGKAIEVPPAKALHLVRNYVDTRPLEETWQLATGILSASVIGYVDPDKSTAQKKTEAAEPEPEATPAAG
jgi:hypothetical protein